MLLDVEISILRGFLTPNEETAWKQDIYSVTGQTTEYFWTNAPHKHERCRGGLVSSTGNVDKHARGSLLSEGKQSRYAFYYYYYH